MRFRKLRLIAALVLAFALVTLCSCSAGKDILSDINGQFSEAFSEAVDDAKSEIGGLFSDARDEFSSAVETARTAIDSAVSEARTGIDSAVDEIRDEYDSAVSDARTGIDSAVSEARTAVDSALGEAGDSIASAITAADTTAPPAKSYSFRSKKLYDQHFDKHGAEFGNITKAEYLSLANALIADGSERILHKMSSDGDYMYYDPDNNYFLVLSADGYIRTFFRPDNGIKYWNKQ